MKIKKILLFATLLIGGFVTANASDQDTNTTISNPVPIPVKDDTPSLPGRPKAPSKQHIECWYFDGELSFDFVIPEGECTLYLTDYSTGFMTQYTFDSSYHADISVGTLPNGGSLEIHTESGHTYTGSF